MVTPQNSDFLYPFIEGDEIDPEGLLEALESSALEKAQTSFALRQKTLQEEEMRIAQAGEKIAIRLKASARIFVFGNGGSSTDAATLVKLFSTSPAGIPVAARHLVGDYAVLSALANDIGFDVVFSRQLMAHGTPGDIAIGYSTSGNSKNLMSAFEYASGLGMLSIGFAGYDGGNMARSPSVEYCLTVPSESIHRIQEVQAALSFALWQQVQLHLRAEATL